MPDKELRFVATLDDSQLTQAMANITQKMKAMQNFSASAGIMSKMGAGANLQNMSPQTQQAFDQAFKRQTDSVKQFYGEQKTLLDKAASQQLSITKELNSQIDALGKLNKESKEYEETQKRIAQLKKDQASSDDEMMRLAPIVSKAAQASGIKSQTAAPATGMMGQIANVANSGNMGQMIVALGGSAAIVGAVAKAVSTGIGFWENQRAMPRETLAAQASAVSGRYDREISAMYTGRAGAEASLRGEKDTATAMAEKEKSVHEFWSYFSKTGIQSVLGSKSAETARQQSVEAALVQDREQNLQNLINKNPELKAARENYYANQPQELQFQRQTGLNYESFHGQGGFKETAINARFDPKLAMEMSKQILAAGGSSGAAGGENAVLGLQAQRNFNLTNAGSVLGKLGMNNASQGENKEALVRILAEGTKLGFDGSHYVEESRRFTEQVADIIARSASGNAEDAARAAKSFAGFVAEPGTTKGIEAAKGAYETYQQESGATSGRQGVLRAAGFLSSPKLKKLSNMTRNVLASLPENMLTEEDPTIQQAAREAGVNPSDIIDEITKVNKTSAFGGFKGAQKDLQRRQELIQSKFGGMSPEQRQKRLDELEQVNQRLTTTARFVAPGNLSGAAATSLFSGIAGQGEEYGPAIPKEMREATRQQLTSTAETGKIEDKTEVANALAASEMLKTFRESKDILVPTTEALTNYNKALEENLRLMKETGLAIRPEATGISSQQRKLQDAQKRVNSGSSNQQQAGWNSGRGA